MKKRDMFLLAGAVAIVTFLWMAPEETTAPVPHDEAHERFYEIAAREGRREAEKYCVECHNDDMVPFTENHPTTFRCLFCHKLK